ncbi:MAG: hypothetical protein LBG28_16125, partial [Tannerella sp.]|nr:hypothetical protein [Tannerella sp.]
NSAISSSDELTPIVFHSRKRPPLLSTTTTLVRPDLFFFLRTNMTQSYCFFACVIQIGDARFLIY